MFQETVIKIRFFSGNIIKSFLKLCHVLSQAKLIMGDSNYFYQYEDIQRNNENNIEEKNSRQLDVVEQAQRKSSFKTRILLVVLIVLVITAILLALYSIMQYNSNDNVKFTQCLERSNQRFDKSGQSIQFEASSFFHSNVQGSRYF